MSNGMNKVILLGYLGDDPDLRIAQNGAAKLRFRLATTDVWRDKETGEKRERTEWHTITMWGNRAEPLHRLLEKGQKVMVEGRLETWTFEDDQGKTRYVTEVKARDIAFAGSSPSRRIPAVPVPDEVALADRQLADRQPADRQPAGPALAMA